MAAPSERPAMRACNYDVMFDVEERHWWFHGRRAVVMAQIEGALAGRAPAGPRRVLDVGCGTGINLGHLARFGWTAGMDVSLHPLRLCRRRGAVAVLCASAARLPFADGAFSLVTALDVIEHLDDDVAGLREMARVMAPGAALVLFVPAFQALWGPNDDQVGHRRRYRHDELCARVRDAGLRVRHASYANCAMFAPIWAGRRLLRLLGREGQAENRINLPLVNGALARLFALEAGWLVRHRLPFGVSLVCVAERSA